MGSHPIPSHPIFRHEFYRKPWLIAAVLYSEDLTQKRYNLGGERSVLYQVSGPYFGRLAPVRVV